MTTRFSRKLLALFTTIALIALPAADAFAGRNWATTDHHSHVSDACARYLLGNNWNATDHRSNHCFTTLHHLDLIVARSI